MRKLVSTAHLEEGQASLQFSVTGPADGGLPPTSSVFDALIGIGDPNVFLSDVHIDAMFPVLSFLVSTTTSTPMTY